MRYRFTRQYTVTFTYNWHCGDGCCDDYYTDYETFSDGDEIDLCNGVYENEVILETFKFKSSRPWNEYDACPRIEPWQLDELMGDGILIAQSIGDRQ
jgi:hypothetical protein